jgi:hypothetical protein
MKVRLSLLAVVACLMPHLLAGVDCRLQVVEVDGLPGWWSTAVSDPESCMAKMAIVHSERNPEAALDRRSSGRVDAFELSRRDGEAMFRHQWEVELDPPFRSMPSIAVRVLSITANHRLWDGTSEPSTVMAKCNLRRDGFALILESAIPDLRIDQIELGWIAWDSHSPLTPGGCEVELVKRDDEPPAGVASAVSN